MSVDTITLTRQGDRWFAFDEETGLTASGQTRQQALDSLAVVVAGGASDGHDDVSIVETADVLHGKPRIDGTRIGVLMLGESVRRAGQSVDALVNAYPGLTEREVETALAYYDSHPDEMATLRDDEEQLVRRVREQGRAP